MQGSQQLTIIHTAAICFCHLAQDLVTLMPTITPDTERNSLCVRMPQVIRISFPRGEVIRYVLMHKLYIIMSSSEVLTLAGLAILHKFLSWRTFAVEAANSVTAQGLAASVRLLTLVHIWQRKHVRERKRENIKEWYILHKQEFICSLRQSQYV